MDKFLDFLLEFLVRFGGGSGKVDDNLVRFSLAAMFWAALLVVAWSRQRQYELPREELLVWGFGLGLGRELFMLGIVSVQMLGLVEGETVRVVFPPLELALGTAAVVVVAGSFLRYILDDVPLSRRYLQIGLTVTGICYLTTFWWWALHSTTNPEARYPQTWGAWLFQLGAATLTAIPIIFLIKKQGWLRNVVLLALTFFFMSQFLMLFNPITGETDRCFLCPISHNFYIWAIPLLGYVYIREQSIERAQAEKKVRRRNKELIALNEIAAIISQSLDLDRTLNAILDKVLTVVNMSAGWIHLLDKDGGVLSLMVQSGFSQRLAQEPQTLGPGQGPIGKVIQTGQPTIVNDVSDDLRHAMDFGRREGLHAFVSIPIKSRDKALGVLSVFGSKSYEWNPQKVQLLTAIGHQIGVAVENARLAQEVSRIEILQELNRLRSELIANVSHEVRTPLGLIKYSCTSLLAEDVEFDREVQWGFLRGIDQETDKLMGIVDNLLDLSHIGSGLLRLDKHPTDVGQLVRDVTANIKVQTAHHRFAHSFSPDPLVAAIDPRRIEQVLRNLLINAVKYSPKGGEIIINGREENGQLVIRVCDEGIGISPQDLERVFERFYRVENETTQKVGGVGLGLAISRSVAEAHGGRIWVESVLGKGSTFYLVLPRDAIAPV